MLRSFRLKLKVTILKNFLFYCAVAAFIFSCLIILNGQTILRSQYSRLFARNYLSKVHKNEPKLFCMITTTKKNLINRAITVNKSWASKCDKYVFVTVIDPTVVDLSIEKLVEGLPVLQPQGFNVDQYKILTDKVFKTIIHIHKMYNKYDWYLKADDDTFVFVANLKRFLHNKNSSAPVTYGYDFKVIVDGGYHSGGAGYVFSKESLNRIGPKLRSNYSFCRNSGIEDIDVARCFRKVGVNIESSLDSFGKERFHPLNVGTHFLGGFPGWMYNYAKNPIQTGMNCCSEESISFHYVKESEIRKLGVMVDIYEKFKEKGIKKINFTSILYSVM